MANRLFHRPWTYGRERVLIEGSFSTATAGTVSTTFSNDRGISSIVATTTAGAYTITLSDVFNSISSICLTPGGASGANVKLQKVSATASTKTIKIRTVTHTGSAVTLVSGTVDYQIYCKNTAIHD